MELNFPDYQFKTQKQADKVYIFDIIRKKFILLVPEEWVRQHLIHFLIEHNYPKSLLKIEGGHQYNQLKKRTDILVYDRSGRPFMIAECKAPNIKITDSVLRQAAIYNSKYQAPNLMVTNGLVHYYFQIDFTDRSFNQLDNLPAFL